MELWNVRLGAKSTELVHDLAPGFGHALLAPLFAYVFRTLGVAAAVWEHAHIWFALHDGADFDLFEQEHGKDVERRGYNGRCFAEARRKKAPVHGEFGGYSDLFVPIIARGKVVGILVTGPLSTERLTSTAIEERWRSLTGRAAHPTDAEFASYLAATLNVLVLTPTQFRAFERLARAVATLMAGEGDATALANQLEVDRRVLEPIRAAERSWATAREMVDERSSQASHSAGAAFGLGVLGLSRVPEVALVGLAVAKEGIDFVDQALRVDRFQREIVELARKSGAIAGRVGNQGVVLLAIGASSDARRRRALVDLSERSANLARRGFGLSLHFGASTGLESSTLSATYQAALGAAEAALIQGKRLVFAEHAVRGPASLRKLREELSRAVEERPALLLPRFERYLELAALHGGYRIDLTRVHLEVAFEQVAGGLAASGALEAKSLTALSLTLDRASAAARTLAELLPLYRRAVGDLVAAVESPVAARHDRGLRGATEYIREHFTEQLDFKKVARVAGFTPNYFSRLFREREGVSFQHYVRGLRIERAKQLLVSTELDVKRVLRLSGFHAPEYFNRAFRKLVGTTPLAFRDSPSGPSSGQRTDARARSRGGHGARHRRSSKN